MRALRVARGLEVLTEGSVQGALINGVFLLALCFSIGLEAITRFFNYVGTCTLRRDARRRELTVSFSPQRLRTRS